MEGSEPAERREEEEEEEEEERAEGLTERGRDLASAPGSTKHCTTWPITRGFPPLHDCTNSEVFFLRRKPFLLATPKSMM